MCGCRTEAIGSRFCNCFPVFGGQPPGGGSAARLACPALPAAAAAAGTGRGLQPTASAQIVPGFGRVQLYGHSPVAVAPAAAAATAVTGGGAAAAAAHSMMA